MMELQLQVLTQHDAVTSTCSGSNGRSGLLCILHPRAQVLWLFQKWSDRPHQQDSSIPRCIRCCSVTAANTFGEEHPFSATKASVFEAMAQPCLRPYNQAANVPKTEPGVASCMLSLVMHPSLTIPTSHACEAASAPVVRLPHSVAIDDMHSVCMAAIRRTVWPREVHIAAMQHHQCARRHLRAMENWGLSPCVLAHS